MHLAILSGGDGWHVRDLMRAATELDCRATHLDFRTLSAAVAQTSNSLDAFDAILVRTMPHGSLEQVVFRMDLLHLAEAKGIPVLNPPRALEICIDKFLCSARLERAGLPVPRTVACQDADAAMVAYYEFGGDVVVKPLFGSEGRGMIRVHDPELAWRSFRTLERIEAVLYVQEFIHHPGWDLRLFVLGDEVLAGMKRIGNGDWRTNVAQGARAEVYAPTSREVEIAIRAARAVGTIAAGVDLIYDASGNVYVIEVNAVPGWRTLAPTTGVDVARRLLMHFLPVENGEWDVGHAARVPVSTRSISELAREPRAPRPIPHLAQLACLFEATARKVGNVHRSRDFDDLTYLDFVLSAAAIAPVMELALSRSIGETVLRAVAATRRVVKTNTNLGIILLLAPLAATGDRTQLTDRLASLTVEDSVLVYRAIRLAQPGGLGEVREQDVVDEPTLPLRELMALAQDRDSIAAEYVNGFTSIFELGVPSLLEGWERLGSLEAAILFCQLNWLQTKGDSLLRRKRGDAENESVRKFASGILELGLETEAGRTELTRLDAWLRQEGHSRNPGTTADLVTACLFVALRERKLTGTEPFPWTAWTGS